jgi:hypothetical protein
MSKPDEGYSRNLTCALISISTFLLLNAKKKKIKKTPAKIMLKIKYKMKESLNSISMFSSFNATPPPSKKKCKKKCF